MAQLKYWDGSSKGWILMRQQIIYGVGGSGSGAGAPATAGANGGSGVVILRYPVAQTITIGAGLTGTTATVGANKVTTITAGTGNVSWT